MDQFACKTFVTSRSFTYTYYHLNHNNGKPTLLLQHGFPDDHNLWCTILPYLTQSPYSILVPDLLGYGGSSKPSDTASYNSSGMADDLAEILDMERIDQVISIGHDWGSFMAQRVWLWHPEKVAGVILLNVAYAPPAPFDMAVANEIAEKMTGLPRLAYWEFFVAPDCARILHDNIESWFEALHGSPDNWLETLFCHRAALSDFVRQGKRVTLKSYAEPLRSQWISTFKKFGFHGPLQWYLAQVNGHHWNVEKDIPESRHKITVPVLFIGAKHDTVCRTEAIHAPAEGGLLPDLTIKEVDSGHWPMLESPDTAGPIILEWLEQRHKGF
ncbi:epoxide hydrolase-like protein [Xylogone sp. PMI_703]|nr:epoxide hydrolase-like protein [Xylogone sp. PMI_703]